MSIVLPINLDNLLRSRVVESERLELKASWNREATGPQVLKTICAFANDYNNLNGGYVVIGVAESEGEPVLPPSGLTPAELEDAQKWIVGNCNRLDPPYRPVLAPAIIDERNILVVWAPASETGVHRAPEGPGSSPRYCFWVRLGSQTVDAERRGDMATRLLRQKTGIPWDDRPQREAMVENMSETMVREHLLDTRSGLFEEPDTRAVYRRMRIVAKINDHEIPRNVGLLFFSRTPSQWFRGATIEVVQFSADRAGDVQEDRIFSGGLANQLRDCLNYLQNLSTSHLQKQENGGPARVWASYPMPALQEILVNAICHRGYDVDQPEPTKVYLYPGRIDVISYPGPVPGVDLSHFVRDAAVPVAPARNRRIGEFLKELKLAERRFSGLPKIFRAMESNGSPEPRFDFDEHRSYFRATLPAHPEYEALSAARDAAHLRVLGQREEALKRIESAWEANPSSAVLASEMIRFYGENNEFTRAEEILKTFTDHGPETAVPYVENTLAEALVAGGDVEEARRLLGRHRRALSGQDAIDAAIMARRARDSSLAHRYFASAGDLVFSNPRALLEFAQTKLWLARESKWKSKRNSNKRLLGSSRRLVAEARELLERLLQMDASPTRHAWAWRELARALDMQRAPIADIERAYLKAIELLPGETRFAQELTRVRRRR